MTTRKAQVKRETKETNIDVDLCLDGAGEYSINTGVGFLDHMLELFSKHGFFNLKISAKGDLHVDEHHTVEDIGIVLGGAFKKALGDCSGIARYGFSVVPMDESLGQVTVDISGRPCLEYRIKCRKRKSGSFDLQMIEEFFRAFAVKAEITIHIESPYGVNAHHVYESVFKAFGRAMDIATSIEPRRKGIPSSKGIL
ncbi:MAG: imidazoleglycerol-phosphate dehydratase HisB [Candidatus Theseobacter exili]|nr:imidazoleglycerol-phosphate dehydratase HisB [Candidatus Theseobacter exili]